MNASSLIRRTFLKSAAAGIAAASTSAVFAQGVTTINVASWAGPNHAINALGWKRLAAAIDQKSGGSLKLDITFPPVNPRVMFDRVQEGISDMAWGFNGYTPGRFFSYQIVELPGLGADAEAASVAYWRTYEKYFAKANEYAGIRLLTLFAQPPSVLHTRKQVTSIADMKGMKIRVGGGVQAEVASRLGMVGVQAPVSEAYQMIKDGIVDGTFFPAETALSFKLNEVARHQLALRDGLFGAAYFVVMNEGKYAGLSPAHKRVVDEVSGEPMAALFGKAWDEAETAAIAALKPTADGGYRVAADPLAKQISDLLKPIDDVFLQSAAKKGSDAKEALAYLRSEARKPSAKR